MKSFLHSAGLLIRDLASSLVFILLFSITHDAVLSACLGMLLGMAQIAIQFVRRKLIDAMEWLSILLVLASGTATVLTDDPRFVLFKPTAISADLATWALAMTVFGILSKAILSVAGFLAIRMTARRRIRAMTMKERDALYASTGWVTRKSIE